MNHKPQNLWLFSFRRCPYAIRARMAFSFFPQDLQLIEVDLKHKPELLSICSPKATVPVLLIEQQESVQVIDESEAMMFWWLEQNIIEAWLCPKTTVVSADYQEIIQSLEASFIPNLQQYKYSDNASTKNSCADQLSACLKHWSQGLMTGSKSLLAKPSLADLMVFPHLRQLIRCHDNQCPVLDINQHQAILQWYQSWESMPQTAAVMLKNANVRKDSEQALQSLENIIQEKSLIHMNPLRDLKSA